MKLKINTRGFWVLGLAMLVLSCNEVKEQENNEIPTVNLNHLMHLYDVVDLPGNVCGGIVHIYSEYPDYEFEIEPNEGFTCVDDVARAMMIDSIRFSNDEEMQAQYDFMAEFLLYMQADNGWFHNFIWHDMSINKTYRTSVAEPNWWSWRAFWALANYQGNNKQLAAEVKTACEKLAENTFGLLLNQPMISDTIEGVVAPTWFPLGTAGDQAALVIIGMDAYYRQVNNDQRALILIERMAEGIVLTQKGDAETFPHGAFLSWENLWHAYGNCQAYALLKAGQLLKNEAMIRSALIEINHFYPYLMEAGYPASFSLKRQNGQFEMIEKQDFPQIAYGFRPMIWACVESYELTGDEKYLHQAKTIISWFNGNNIAGQKMYDAETGRCFDGIVSPNKVNKNAGAESTIEALLALQVFENIKQ